MILKAEIYNEVISKVISHKGHYRDLEAAIVKQYKIPRNTVSSIIANEYKRKMKKNHYKLFSAGAKLFQRYQEAVSANKPPSVIMKLADEVGLSYTLLARMILEKCYDQKNSTLENSVKTSNIKSFMKDPSLIEDPKLAYEIHLCCLYDDQYGNITEVTRHSLGQEYEYYLQEKVKSHNLSFQSEDDLRVYGYDKTPDIKLNIPFAVDGFVINWIESKALFGDPEVHKGYVKDQYSSYWNRFGTGMVIYWLGLVETIIDPSEKRFIVRYDFPTNMTMTNPMSIASLPSNVENVKTEKT